VNFSADHNRLVLASASPRRARSLRQLGLSFEMRVTDTAEIHEAHDPVHTVTTNARAKLEAVRPTCPELPLLAADTLVHFEGRLIGKPRDLDEAATFLRDFSGRTQLVYTAVALAWPGQAVELRVEASSVTFRRLSESTIAEYLARTRPLDRAGAYDIDENGELLVAGYSGSYTNIMGLPAEVVRDWWRAGPPTGNG